MNARPEIVAAIQAKYPQKAEEAERSCVAHGAPISVVGGTHQKYRLSDGTVVTMDYIAPPPPPVTPPTVVEQAVRVRAAKLARAEGEE